MAADTTVHQDSSIALAASWEDLLKVLSQPDPLADLIIDVEGHQLHTSKYLLASASPKFRQMFTDPAAENISILPLTGVSLRATVDLLQWLLPSQPFTIQEKSMEALLQFVCDYDIKELHKECDRYVTNKLRMSTVAHKDRLRYLILAERFALADALGHALSLLSCLTMEELTSLEHLEDLKSSTLCQIMRKHTRTKEFEPQHYACAPASFPETITLVVDDREIEVSTAALVTASDVFNAMITSDFLERNTGRITLWGKSYNGVAFMVNYITSQDYIPMTGELLAECVDLAEEYMLGRLKHACSEYMISDVDRADLNDCLLYLRLAHQYQFTDVENKVLQVIYQRSTADMLACRNYDITFVATLLLRHSQWLEKRVRKYQNKLGQEVYQYENKLEEEVRKSKNKVETVTSWLTEISRCLSNDVSSFFDRLHDATYKCITYPFNVSCSCGSPLMYGDGFLDSCAGCAYRSRQQFRSVLDELYEKTVAQPKLNIYFLNTYNKEVLKLKKCLAT